MRFMSSNVRDLSGQKVYMRLVPDSTPMPKTTALADLVGEGKLIAQPNDLVVGNGSKWIHPRVDTHVYTVFGQHFRRHKYGRYSSGRCILMLPVDWWEERESEWIANRTNSPLEMRYAEIAYPIISKGRYWWVYAGKFMVTRRVDFPALKNTKLDGSGSLLIDRSKDMHFEFSGIGREVEIRPNGAIVEQ